MKAAQKDFAVKAMTDKIMTLKGQIRQCEQTRATHQSHVDNAAAAIEAMTAEVLACELAIKLINAAPENGYEPKPHTPSGDQQDPQTPPAPKKK